MLRPQTKIVGSRTTLTFLDSALGSWIKTAAGTVLALALLAATTTMTLVAPYHDHIVGEHLYRPWLDTHETLSCIASEYLGCGMTWPTQVTDKLGYAVGGITRSGSNDNGQALDGWGNVVYAVPSENSTAILSIQSAGPDGVFGGADSDDAIIAFDHFDHVERFPWQVEESYRVLSSATAWGLATLLAGLASATLLFNMPRVRQNMRYLVGVPALILSMTLGVVWMAPTHTFTIYDSRDPHADLVAPFSSLWLTLHNRRIYVGTEMTPRFPVDLEQAPCIRPTLNVPSLPLRFDCLGWNGTVSEVDNNMPGLGIDIRFISGPLWHAVLPLATVALITLAPMAISSFKRHPGHCPCGYNLQGNVSGICPECGTPTRIAG